MSIYHEVVLRDAAGEYVARINPSDYGYSIKTGAGGPFDTDLLPDVLAAAQEHFGRTLAPIWVDDMSGDGGDSVPWGESPPAVPWDGPVSLYYEPELPYLVPPGENNHSVPRSRAVQRISIAAPK